MAPKQLTSVRLANETKTQLDELANQTGKSQAEIMGAAIEQLYRRHVADDWRKKENLIPGINSFLVFLENPERSPWGILNRFAAAFAYYEQILRDAEDPITGKSGMSMEGESVRHILLDTAETLHQMVMDFVNKLPKNSNYSIGEKE